MDAGETMRSISSSQSGFSLIESLIAMCVLTVGAVGMASVFMYGMQSTISSPNEVVAAMKAQEAVEGVFSARDSHTVTWAKLRNASQGGIFLDGLRDMKIAGEDGVVNTVDDGPIESVALPGPDQTLGTGDDKIERLTEFKRQIVIADISPVLRSITVTIKYPAGSAVRTHTLTTYISAYA
jgi:prepilin-type N-terminal cleavage/methylation domain-containing protein